MEPIRATQPARMGAVRVPDNFRNLHVASSISAGDDARCGACQYPRCGGRLGRTPMASISSLPEPLFDPHLRVVPAETLERLAAFSEAWCNRKGREEQLSQSFLLELCDALGVARPGGAARRPFYAFEHPVHYTASSERGKIDLYKEGCFVLEAKCGRTAKDEPGSAPVRGTKQYAAYIERAYREQALLYAGHVEGGPPPLLIVVDIGHRFWIWRGFDGRFDGFHSPHRIEIPLADIAEEEGARILRACFESPQDLDTSRYQARITRDAVETLAPLARQLEAALEGAPRAGERVARFLMRCLFCMFAEDVELLPHGHFTNLLHKALQMPKAFAPEAERLFAAMDAGGSYDFKAVRRFNGALFRDAEALPLDGEQLGLLADAASRDWSLVDPAIFGTLLERALDPAERHRLGAHFTPRHYVERLVRATIEEPLRREWEAAQARVYELVGDDPDAADPKERLQARQALAAFHSRLCAVRVLDPACGTGNFLYVSYAVLKELEHEVLEAGRVLSGVQGGLAIEGESVVPEHLHGLEIKPWAAEIAQLVLWIGHLQWELRHRTAERLNEPLLSEERSIECRDALIEWEREVSRTADDGSPVTRWDGRTMRVHPSTGAEVPNETARIPVVDYEGVRRARWPAAEFVVGNPPFLGNKHMRTVLGDAYVDAVRDAYVDDAPNTVDFVMYWWDQAARRVRAADSRRFGLITTNSIRQTHNRQVVARHLDADPPLRLVMAVPDHPWVDDGADVRIAMTVGEAASGGVTSMARLVEIVPGSEDEGEARVSVDQVARIHADLRAGVDLTSAVPLQSNKDVSFQGMNLVGKGFRLSRAQVGELGYDPENLPPVIRPYLNAREMMQTRLDRFVIDAYGLSAEELRAQHPALYQWLYDHVKPERDHNRDAQRRRQWWLFGRSNEKLRAAVVGLDCFIATPETSKHRVFARFDAAYCPDHKLYAIALSDLGSFGILMSRPHRAWALRAGGRMGVGNDPTYNNTRCFLSFPFPEMNSAQRCAIGQAAEAIEAHLGGARSRSAKATLTAIYNLVDARRADEVLSDKEQKLHAAVATDVLIGLHDRLDEAVLETYGLPPDVGDEALLAFLLELNYHRADEEARGEVRWLRPDRAEELQSSTQGRRAVTNASTEKLAWPKDPFEQMASVLAIAQSQPGPFDIEALASHFHRATKKRIKTIVSVLLDRRLLLRDDNGRLRTPGAA